MRFRFSVAMAVASRKLRAVDLKFNLGGPGHLCKVGIWLSHVAKVDTLPRWDLDPDLTKWRPSGGPKAVSLTRSSARA